MTNSTVVITSSSWLRRLYDWIIRSANTPQAIWTLVLISFAESSFFPLPPDLMLVPMILADRTKAWWLALLCTISSVFGGLVGYAIGFFLFETVGEWIIQTYHLENTFRDFQSHFQDWGFWYIIFKGFTPIPFKIVTIASGLAKLNLTTFIIASIIARGLRFFFVAGVLWRYGEQARPFIEKHLPWVLIASLAILIAGFLVLKIIAG